MKTTGFLVGLILLGTPIQWGEAAPYVAVVPKEIQVDSTAPQFKISFMYWGWIGATGEALTEQDLDDAVVTVLIDDPEAFITMTPFQNLSSFAPLDSGEVAGLRLDPGNAVYDTLLQAGESLKSSAVGLFETTIGFPPGHVDTALVTATITMAGQELSYFTTVYFGEFALLRPEVLFGQRIPSVPIPVPVSPATWGSLKQKYGLKSYRRGP